MSPLALHLEALSDISPAASRERGFSTPAYPFIPGGALRGALAAVWMRRNGAPQSDPERFNAEVLSLRVGPGLAIGSSQRPLSVYACKYPQSAACNATYDAAFGEVPADTLCPGCGRRLEGSKGQWTGVRRLTRTRTALDVDGTAKEASLFARESLAAGQTFLADIHGDTSWLEGTFTLRVGGERSTAGSMRASLQQVPEAPLPPAGQELVVRLASPAVFVGHDGRTALEPQPGDLERALRGTNAPAGDVVVTRRWVRTETFGGWNAAGGLPKATEAVVSPASTFVLRLPPGQAWTQTWMRALLAAGLGVRRADGLGWIEIAASSWQPGQIPASEAHRAAPSEQIQAATNRVCSLNDRGFIRQVIGWLAEGYTDTEHPPGYAYEGLPAEYRTRADEALAVRGEAYRRALLIALSAQHHRVSRETQGGDRR